MISIIQKIPILTTLLSAVFFVILFRHWARKGKPAHLFWWTFGILAYGLGTLTESIVGLFGWSAWAFRAWYILGALLGGFPLAQGTVFLMLKRKWAITLMIIVSSIIVITAVFVLLSPINYDLVEPSRLTGKVLAWNKVRMVTPIVNIYAFIFLVGGAVYSAYKYSRNPDYRTRFIGNILIACGGLLPGIGGSFTKFGYTEVLYVMELLGILLIYFGYRAIRRDNSASLYITQQPLLNKFNNSL